MILELDELIFVQSLLHRTPVRKPNAIRDFVVVFFNRCKHIGKIPLQIVAYGMRYTTMKKSESDFENPFCREKIACK